MSDALQEFTERSIERLGELGERDEACLRELIVQECRGHSPGSRGAGTADAVAERADSEEWAARAVRAATANLVAPLVSANDRGGPPELARAARRTGRDADQLVDMVLDAMAQTATPDIAQP
ncbi:hypothetical protein [Streptomyces californicus]|uniref:hypothetical protein n=1 Tax=Streptomyces californicus TaxID=67351 RepID=UPI00296FDC3C|nr:hypothetical protein [Streptomyces californicus]MDW4912619.1 hypothetical protein [Streptomyces californicus]